MSGCLCTYMCTWDTQIRKMCALSLLWPVMNVDGTGLTNVMCSNIKQFQRFTNCFLSMFASPQYSKVPFINIIYICIYIYIAHTAWDTLEQLKQNDISMLLWEDDKHLFTVGMLTVFILQSNHFCAAAKSMGKEHKMVLLLFLAESKTPSKVSQFICGLDN